MFHTLALYVFLFLLCVCLCVSFCACLRRLIVLTQSASIFFSSVDEMGAFAHNLQKRVTESAKRREAIEKREMERERTASHSASHLSAARNESNCP